MRGSPGLPLLFAGLVLFSMPVVGMYTLFDGFDLGHDLEHDAALAEYWRGHEEFDAGHHLAAIPHYEVWRQYLRQRGSDDSEVTGSIAGCLWRGGRHDEALREFDASLARNPRWYVCVEKAHCLAQQDPAAALDWLRSQPLPPEVRSRAVADFHRQRGNYAAAIAALEDQLRQLDAASHFDAEGHLRGFGLPLPTERHNQLASLIEPFEHLAECRFRNGEIDRAEAAARRGLAASQRMLESKGYYEPEQERAGSVPCRLLLARIAMERRAWPLAAEHARLAQLLADRGSYTPHQDAARAVVAEVAQRQGR
ncbi:MAG: hypothetical protein H6838_05390 [Planctomycetes bacterium]|nr:hypothetical protein [Planctomycetota bacterium]MCB9884904.1 hypothetical protein [Planctomycetota bacterium]